MLWSPFDAHNHVHMGPNPPLVALPWPGALSPSCSTTSSLVPVSAPETAVETDRTPRPEMPTQSGNFLSGMAVMSTHPRDYAPILTMAEEIPRQFPTVKVVPCLGVHPWFLHQLSDQDWQPVAGDPKTLTGTSAPADSTVPNWLFQLEKLLQENPQAMVGEIGLDGFHFDPISQQLVSPLDQQQLVMEWQLELAARYQRPVSIHCVQSFGLLMESLSRLKKKKLPLVCPVPNTSFSSRNKVLQRKAASTSLPPKLYFHAFGGKVGTVDQLLAICDPDKGDERTRGQQRRVYFGFAPIVNFRSTKTAQVMQRVGIERIVLESDHEDASLVTESMQECIAYLASTFKLDPQTVIEQTTKNALELYGLEER